jgi:hypothetical protein
LGRSQLLKKETKIKYPTKSKLTTDLSHHLLSSFLNFSQGLPSNEVKGRINTGQRNVRALEKWRDGEMEHWSVGEMEKWSIGASSLQLSNAPMPQCSNAPFPPCSLTQYLCAFLI